MGRATEGEVRTAAVVGGGVIGAGWVARLLLNGIDVAVFDPAPGVEARTRAVLANAERAWRRLTSAPLPDKGELTFAPALGAAVEGATWIVEAVPERQSTKQAVYADVERFVEPDVVIASSTSGLLPSDLQAGLRHPERLLVAHPFNPVYLLPLVEIVPGKATSSETVERAMAFTRSLGMQPLLLRREIEAFVADRLLESVWREALWLIRDGICTTEELDDAVRFGFGLRYAQMGVFETYRIAGGEAGMRHFLAQFGPCLKWPWTHLTDVPELDQALVDKIGDQSDAQSGRFTIEELERIRDDNLVGILRALGANDWGAGKTVRRFERQLLDRATPELEADDLAAPIRTVERIVPIEGVDTDGHRGEAFCLACFREATDTLLRLIGVDAAYLEEGGAYITAETHIRHLAAAEAGDRIHTATRVIEARGKQLQLYHELLDGAERLLATGEHLLLHVSLRTRAASEPGPVVKEKLGRLARLHGKLPRPPGLARFVDAVR